MDIITYYSLLRHLPMNFRFLSPIQALLTTYSFTYIEGIKAEQFDKSFF